MMIWCGCCLLLLEVCASAELNDLKEEESNGAAPVEDKEYVLCMHSLL